MDARTTAGSTVKYGCNPTCPSRKLFKRRPTRRGGIHAARAPRQYHQPTPCHPVGAGHARPATYPIPQLVANAQQIPNMHLAQKYPLKNLSKKSKTTLDNSHTHCYNNQAVPRRKPRQALLSTVCTRFFEENFFKKTFRKPLDNQAFLIYNIQAVTETRQHSRTLKIEQN